MNPLNNNKTIICFEGICGSGKTFSLNNLNQNSYEIVKETVRLVNTKSKQPNSHKNAFKKDMKYIDFDIQKFDYISNNITKDVVIVERWFPGTLSISYCYNSEFNTFNKAVKYLVEKLNKRHYNLPIYFIWFDIDPQLILKRRKEIKKNQLIPNIWYSISYLEKQNYFLKQFFSSIPKQIVYKINCFESESSTLINVHKSINKILCLKNHHYFDYFQKNIKESLLNLINNRNSP